MHVLLEGVNRLEVIQQLRKFIFKFKYFSLDDFNCAIQNFSYNLDDLLDKPQKIEKKRFERWWYSKAICCFNEGLSILFAISHWSLDSRS